MNFDSFQAFVETVIKFPIDGNAAPHLVEMIGYYHASSGGCNCDRNKRLGMAFEYFSSLGGKLNDFERWFLLTNLKTDSIVATSNNTDILWKI